MKVIVIGNGMVGCKFCERLAEAEFFSGVRCTVFGEEPRPAYDRVHLSEYIETADADRLQMKPADWYARQGMELLLGRGITAVDRIAQTVTDSEGNSHPYDKLVFATGSYPFVPPLEGRESPGVFVYRTIEDLDKIREYTEGRKHGIVIGGGLLGLEAAKALMDLGLEASVVEGAPRLMPRQLDEAGASLLTSKLRAMGLGVFTGVQTKKIIPRGDKLVLELADRELETDVIIFSCGIRPRDELARAAGISVHERGGIVADEFMRTSDENIYAIGEAAFVNGMVYGLVGPGYEMAEIAAANLGGASKRFLGADLSTRLKLIGTDVCSLGDAFGEAEGCRTILFQDGTKGIYKRINISEDGKYLLGAVLVGDASDYNLLLQTMLNRIPLPQNPEALIIPSAEGAEIQIPDSATICSCNNITQGEILHAITGGKLESVDAVKSCTRAGTGCGGCMPELGRLLHKCLKDSGKAVNPVICEHFSYSRRELYEIVKINRIRTFDDLLNSHGSGHGCEICKPAVASILAGTWNELIVKQAEIQDTNDRFLANIQKNGTYSVVPRIPGGEITPEGLIAIGETARKYDLYVKITGGQRIDLFGAHLNDLPEIWKELIDAGFESGHAYAKGLRTIKSCVGSTWCRYGVQDSVGMAIRIENRYKGLRAPHKLKGAVTGCLRQCAETDNKDFGLIATEKGWNLYVAGNGGVKPQSAKLLAADLDDDTCLRYIDRYLMYYIRTAAPLTRTATWFNNLEGGMEYLRKVIIDDELGICAELELEMQDLIDRYECEWKAVVEDPARREKFRHFANSPDRDSTIRFVNERGQRVPLPA